MRKAAIDIGTNSCRLLVADIEDSRCEVIRREINTTRLGQGVDATKLLAPEAIERTIKCLREFVTIISDLKVESYRAVATSAVREAANRWEFVEQVYQECGVAVEVIDGGEEAALSYRGVNCGLPLDSSPLVVDLGGGSCEFILMAEENRLALSLPLGAVRATEAGYSSEDIRSILSPLLPYRDKYQDYPLVFVGGTATTLVAVRFAFPEYDPRLVHGQILTYQEVEDVFRLLVSLPLRLRQRLPGLQPERADIILAGAMIVLEVMKMLNRTQIVISETDILDGMIFS